MAERADLSVRGISDLERGVKRVPHQHTVRLLAEALGLSLEKQAELEHSVVRRRGVQTPSSSSAPRSKLPVEPTPFVGREREEGEAQRLLRWGELRLLTLTGPGGVGKTRLALRVATFMQDEFRDGAVFISLAPATTSDRVEGLVAATLGVRERPDQTVREGILAYLTTRQLLLVLDNFEHVLAAASLVADVLAVSPDVRVLVTSRTPLNLRSEQELSVPPMEFPALSNRSGAGALLRYPAIALFVQRALAVNLAFTVNDETIHDVVGLCRVLDGLPLAIELAASRVRFLPVSTLLAQIEQHVFPRDGQQPEFLESQRLRILTDGPRDLPVRQQTMRATIEWSYSLLQPREAVLFRRLAVFLGGVDEDAASALVPEFDEEETRHLLHSLVEQSMLTLLPTDNGPRYSLLQVVRDFARMMLEVHGEIAATSDAHAHYFVELAEAASTIRQGPRQKSWLSQLDRDYDDVAAAIRWLRDQGHIERAMRLVGPLAQYLESRVRLRDGQEWTDQLLALDPDEAVDARVRGQVLLTASILASLEGKSQHAKHRGEQSLAAFRHANHLSGIASALNHLGGLAHRRAEYTTALAYLEESLPLYRSLGADWGTTQVLVNMGLATVQLQQFDRAIDFYEEALLLARRRDDALHLGGVLNNLALAYQKQGQFTRAITLQQEAIAIKQQAGDHWGLVISQYNLGEVMRMCGDFTRAAELMREMLQFAHENGLPAALLHAFEGLGELAYDREHPATAVLLLATSARLREEIGMPIAPTEKTVLDPIVTRLRADLGDELFQQQWDRGHTMPLDAVVHIALTDGDVNSTES